MEKQQSNQSNLPLVRTLRPLVKAWREGGYREGTTETTRRLLEWWFIEDHQLSNGESFKFYDAQRDAIERLIFCYEVLQGRSLYQLAQKLDAHIPIDPSADKWAKYAFKMATGSGKTMVMAMSIVWSYFNATREKRGEFSMNFVLIAPNLIVLDRLMGDSHSPEFFEGGIFKKYPFLPPEWNSDFQLDVIGPEEERASTKNATLYLLNWQKFVERENGNTANPVQNILGPKPPSEIAVMTAKLKDRLSQLKNVMVLNDEAHHVWDEDLVWYKAIAELYEKTGLMCQLDFSATPKDQAGNLFTHIITEYTLSEAIRDQIVKTPKIAEIENIPELESDDAAERYRVQIDAAVDKWRTFHKSLKKTGKRPILFIMAENTVAADQVADYLDTFREFSDKVLTIHTDKSGEVSKKDIDKARKWAREIDEPDSQFLAVVSVLMLREGWDVRNVKVIAPLRPLSAESKILPEQTLGRGLRRMFPGQFGFGDELIVIEHPAFHDLIQEALAEQGVEIEFVPVTKPETVPKIISVDENKKGYDVAVPITHGGITRSVKKLQELKVSDLPSPLFHYKDLNPTEIKMRKRDLLTKQVEEEEILTMPFADRPDIYISAITKKIQKYSRVPSQFENIAGVTKEYIKNKLFDKSLSFNVDDLKRLNNAKVRVRLIEVFVDRINDLTAVSEDIELMGEELRAVNIKPFPWSRDVFEAKNTVLNFTPIENDFEGKFVKLLHNDDDVLAFIKNHQQTLNFRIPYIDTQGFVRGYIPDFVVKTKDTNWIIET
ncbi:MAG: DEAD/DEAH box helicase family protein, partial [Parcubacteria group bacterium]|nr:DEAD/DEAH box helicase family protein [Parcubacteria group bacterium]